MTTLQHLLPSTAELIEVGPRDGIQTKEKFVPTEMKVETIKRLAEAGIKRIQVTSFVHPRYGQIATDASITKEGRD